MRTRTFLAVFLLLLVLALARGGREISQNPPSPTFDFFQNQKWGTPPFKKEELTEKRVILFLRDAKVVAEIADTETERVRGLSGRTRLGATEGMLFVFPRADYHGIWMKDMMFPLDLIWLEDADKRGLTSTQINADGRIGVHQRGNQRASAVLRVVDVREHVRPETFPEVFYPKEKAKYVLEVNAGFVSKNRLVIGGVLTSP